MKIWPTFRRSLLVPVLMPLLGLGLAAVLSSCDPAADASAIQASTSPPPPTPSTGGGGSTTSGGPTAACVTANNCSQQGFAAAVFAYIGVPDTAANAYAMEKWEAAEGGNWNNSARCNPINTTQKEPGSTSMNGVGVQSFTDAGGQTCWYWGVKANGDTLNNGYYGAILSVFKNGSSSTSAQCQALAVAVAGSPWGTSNFESLC